MDNTTATLCDVMFLQVFSKLYIRRSEDREVSSPQTKERETNWDLSSEIIVFLNQIYKGSE